jgi:hypothetical protein
LITIGKKILSLYHPESIVKTGVTAYRKCTKYREGKAGDVRFTI